MSYTRSLDEQEELARAIYNERRKYEATFMNTIGATILGIGTITPTLAILFDISSAPRSSSPLTGGLIIVSAISGFVCHIIAKGRLKRLT